MKNPKVSHGIMPPPASLKEQKAVRCPNCNAPVRPNQLKCDYCGTWFCVPDVERIVLYADNKPFDVVEKVNGWITRENECRK